ncbi:MAG: hypothetical protein HGJ97_13045 [Desulfosporosinus sp.]|nr:hypothetical protein [Desulfosporosinus sp.]
MKLGMLDAEIEKMDMVKYHRVFVPERKDVDDITDQTPVETSDIYIKDEIPLGQALEELEKTCILKHCYAAITNTDEEMVYSTDKGGNRIVRFKGESYYSLEDLVQTMDIPINWTAVTQINLSFNKGSFNMIFS